MKNKFLPQSFPGKLSVVLGISVPILFFVGFAIDSVWPVYFTLVIIVAWIVSGVVALIKRDWSIITIISAITSIIVFVQIISESWVQQIIKDFIN